MIVFGPLPNLRQIGREQKKLFNKFCNAWLSLVIWYSSYIDPLKRYIFFLATLWWFFYYVVKIVLVFWLHSFHVVISDWHIFIKNKLGNIPWHCVVFSSKYEVNMWSKMSHTSWKFYLISCYDVSESNAWFVSLYISEFICFLELGKNSYKDQRSDQIKLYGFNLR